MRKGTHELRGQPTAIGSMPHQNPQEACSLVFEHLPRIPTWPQLPQRSFVENMYFQFRPSFLTRLREEANGTVFVDMDLSRDVTAEISDDLERLYSDELENRLEGYGIKHDRRAGFDVFLDYLRARAGDCLAAKGQVTGPISWGLRVADVNQRPVLYNDTVADAFARHLKLTAAWQEKALGSIVPNTIISIDEPYLASLGSAFVSLPQEQVIALLEKVFEGVEGLKAIHCCGNTDWSLVLQTSLDILSLDAYNYGETLSLYPREVDTFLLRGGFIAWGIVPSDEAALAEETEDSLLRRLEQAISSLSEKGVSQEILEAQCLITPSCGLATISSGAAERALKLTAGVAAAFRRKHYNEN
jgi:methionine synthase II (cobalamin-independent)